MSGLKLLSATIRYLVTQQSLAVPSTRSENKILRQLGRKKQLLIVPLTFWSGIEQGFFGADFTAVRSTNDIIVGPVPILLLPVFLLFTPWTDEGKSMNAICDLY